MANDRFVHRDDLLPKLNESDLPKLRWKFRRWTGAPVADTHGKKPLIDISGAPLFAEIAMIQVLKEQGFHDALWVDSFRSCFRNGMPPNECTPPPFVSALRSGIRTRAGGQVAST